MRFPFQRRKNCIPAVGGSQIEREILIALVFPPAKKRGGRSKSSDGNPRFGATETDRTGFELYGFLLPGRARRGNVSLEHIPANPEDRNRYTRRGLLGRRPIRRIIFRGKDTIIDTRLRDETP